MTKFLVFFIVHQMLSPISLTTLHSSTSPQPKPRILICACKSLRNVFGARPIEALGPQISIFSWSWVGCSKARSPPRFVFPLNSVPLKPHNRPQLACTANELRKCLSCCW
ncbi:hypothetical protein F5882DRAFT_421630 [Hyaloscypha sp. PMI_1271]|nr:hypothetical protein F5882DRAFT_421630 [Hyaloscypha sp. PMI_1271]